MTSSVKLNKHVYIPSWVVELCGADRLACSLPDPFMYWCPKPLTFPAVAQTLTVQVDIPVYSSKWNIQASTYLLIKEWEKSEN